MKKTIIPAGQPGIFRPSFGQYPEQESRVITWQARHADKKPYSLHRLGASVHNNPAVYAWQYAPAPPPVDDFEAWCEGWYEHKVSTIINYYHGNGNYRYEKGGILSHIGLSIGTFPTLIEAQRAAYEHFLESLKD